MSQHPIEVALAIYRDCQNEHPRAKLLEHTATLGELGLFSNLAIGKIVGLDYHVVGDITGKTDKTGGRFDPEALSLIYDLWAEYNQGIRNERLAASIVGMGISPEYLGRLTGIPRTTLQRWASKGTEAQNE